MNAHNEAIFDCLEDYMDELIENFEDFAKKSLVLIAAALGSIVLMAMYFLRQVTSRNHPNRDVQRGIFKNVYKKILLLKLPVLLTRSIKHYLSRNIFMKRHYNPRLPTW